MQRAQRALDNPALDVAVEAANMLHQPVVIFFAPVPFYPHANLRHYAFLAQGIPDTADRARKRGIGYVLRRYPEHSLLKFCDEVKASLVIGDENPMREPDHWRELAAKKLTVPLWTVDADVLVPSKLLEKEQYAARTIRPRLKLRLEQFLAAPANPKAKVEWQKPRGLHALQDDGSFNITEDWKGLDRSVAPVNSFRGGTNEALRLLHDFVAHKLAHYPEHHGKPSWMAPAGCHRICTSDTSDRTRSRWLSKNQKHRARRKTTSSISSSPGASCPLTSCISIRYMTPLRAHPTGLTALWASMRMTSGQ